VQAQRYSHTLTIVMLLLLEAALYDHAVRNKQFVTVSESCVPLWHGSVVYWQLLLERRSRIGHLRDPTASVYSDKVLPMLLRRLLQVQCPGGSSRPRQTASCEPHLHVSKRPRMPPSSCIQACLVKVVLQSRKAHDARMHAALI
jgi:hypothetical protein